MSIFSSAMSKLFGTHSQREVKAITPQVDRIEAMADTYRQMDDETLRAQTGILKERLNQGETLDDILPEAFAAVREAADRVLGLRPYRVQLIGGIILLITCVLLIILCLMQDQKQDQNMTSAITGGTYDSAYSKNEGNTKEAILKRWTLWLAVIFFVATLVITIMNSEKSVNFFPT